jgi:hypothetical protein
MPTIRCVVPSRAQPGLEVDRRITKAVATRAQRCLGVYCWVGTAGTVLVGDEIAVKVAKQNAFAGAARRAKRITFGLATAAADRLTR